MKNIALKYFLILVLSYLALWVIDETYDIQTEVVVQGINVTKKRDSTHVLSVDFKTLVNTVNINKQHGKINQNPGYLEIVSPFDTCENLRKVSDNSTAVLLATSRDCNLESQLRAADYGKYSIVLVAQNENGRKIERLKNNKFRHIDLVGVISIQDSEILQNYTYPKYIRFFVEPKLVHKVISLERRLQLPYWILLAGTFIFFATSQFVAKNLGKINNFLLPLPGLFWQMTQFYYKGYRYGWDYLQRLDGHTINIQGQVYLLHFKMGKGGFGLVWKVSRKFSRFDPERLSPRKFSVIKEVEFAGTSVRSAAYLQQEFLREVWILQQLNRDECSKFIIQLISFGYEEKTFGAILLEAGEMDLLTYMNRNEADLTIQKFWKIFVKMVTCVKCCHDWGVAHLDVKLSNFVWVKNDLKLVDFGNSYALDFLEQNWNSIPGLAWTPGTVSPEVFMCNYERVGAKADIWALGCILYEHLERRHFIGFQIYEEEVPQIQLNIIIAAIRSIQGDFTLQNNFDGICNDRFVRVLRGCLQFDPEARINDSSLLEECVAIEECMQVK